MVIPMLVYAQRVNVVVSDESAVIVSFGTGKFGFPFNFKAVAPPLSKNWSISVSEFNGRSIFTDEGQSWPVGGYEWTPAGDVELYSAIYYVVAITYSDAKEQVLVTEANRFFIPMEMSNNHCPLIFFDGDTVDISVDLYQNNSVTDIFKFIVDNAYSDEFKNTRVLIRGHAAFITDTPAKRQKEQIGLLELSRKRAIEVLKNLVAEGLDATRIYYESFGGSAAVSDEVEQRWKNRRVEVLFVKDINKELNEELAGSRINEEITQSDTEIKKKKATEDNTVEQISLIIEPSPPIPSKTKIQLNVPPWPDIPILGRGQLKPEHMLEYIIYYVPTENQEYMRYLQRIILYYINESAREHINHDIAFAQMLLETNFLRFNGQVRKEQYNFAGIGVINDVNQGNWFSTELIGVRAHIQHLKGYATTSPLRGAIVDPRYPVLDKLGLLGSSPLVSNLTGRWATDPNYSRNILITMRRMYNYANALMEADEVNAVEQLINNSDE